eukprot:12080059-Heterocapsa_arctica.AAC.1
MYIDVQLKFQGQKNVRWNFDLMSSAIRSGHDSARKLREGFAQWSEANSKLWQQSLAQGPSKGWEFIAEGVVK